MASAARDAVRFVLIDLIADFVLFPVWWYTAGFVRALRGGGAWLRQAEEMMAVRLWARNIFTPMFAQYDLWGRIISFFIRIFNLIGRAIGVLILALVMLLLLLAYLLFPLLLGWLVFAEAIALFLA